MIFLDLASKIPRIDLSKRYKISNLTLEIAQCTEQNIYKYKLQRNGQKRKTVPSIELRDTHHGRIGQVEKKLFCGEIDTCNNGLT